MKTRILKLFLTIILIALPQIGITNSYFTDEAIVEENIVTAGCWAKPEAPLLVYPEDNYVANLGSAWLADPYMDWEDSTSTCPTGTITYIYESYHDFGLTSLAYRSSPLSSSMIAAPGTPDGTYYWRVQAFDGTTYSDWSEVWLLTVDRTPTPTPLPDSVVINEVYYDVGPGKGDEDKNEWIELYNNSDSPVNLKDWSLDDSDSNMRTINANISIPGKGFAVLAHDSSTWAVYWSVPSEAEKINLGGGASAWLNNDDGDWLTLKNAGGTPVDFVAWEGHFAGWNLVAGSGQSIARVVKGVDTDSPLDWQVLGTPNPGTNPHPSILETNLDFSLRPDKLAVGFKVSGSGVSSFDKAEYTITYNSDEGPQAIKGTLDINGASEIEKDNLIFGSCSSGGTCVYQSGVKEVSIEVVLKGAIERTLTAKVDL